MRYPNQNKTIEALEEQSNRELKRIRQEGRLMVRDHWESTKNLLRTGIREFYRRDFGNKNWSLMFANKKGTLHKIQMFVSRALADYHQEAITLNTKLFREVYRESVLRNAYILDTVTPDSYTVTLPRNRMFTEASSIKTYQGPDAETMWKVRWSAWIDAYQNAITTNLKMGALNNSDINSAENEVDATRAGTPAYDMGDAFDRIVLSQAIALQSQAQHDLAGLNPDVEPEEIWQTSFSARVCDICDSQKGMTSDESEYDIPAHPNCECYWRLVPANWADLLKSGDDDDVDLAKWMDANGIVPSSMIVRNDDGDIVGKAIVSFDDWIAGKRKAISTGAR